MKDALRPEEIERLLDALGKTEEGVRNVALATFLLNTGMRIQECLLLNWGDVWDFSKRMPLDEIIIRAETTKTKKERYMPLNAQAKKALRDVWEQYISLDTPVWRSRFMDENGKNIRLHRRQAAGIIARARKRANLHWSITCHSFRHTFVTTLIQTTKDIQLAADLAGHMDLRSTFKYTHRTRDEKTVAVQGLNITKNTDATVNILGEGNIIQITDDVKEKLRKLKAI